MQHHPIRFSFRDLVAGNAFLAYVSVHGSALLAEDADGTSWLHGVQPGGLAAGSTSAVAACAEFKVGYLAVLYDVASDADSFDEFRSRIDAFFGELNGPYAADWRTALDDPSRVKMVTRIGCILPMEYKMAESEILLVTPETATSAMNRLDEFAEVTGRYGQRRSGS